MPEKLARSVVVTPCCRHHSLTERPLLRHYWICAAHSCSSARCFNSALVILTPHNTTVAKRFATFRYYCLMCVQPSSALTLTLLRKLLIDAMEESGYLCAGAGGIGAESRAARAVGASPFNRPAPRIGKSTLCSYIRVCRRSTDISDGIRGVTSPIKRVRRPVIPIEYSAVIVW